MARSFSSLFPPVKLSSGEPDPYATPKEEGSALSRPVLVKWKADCSRIGLFFGIIFAVSGSFLACDCAGFYFLAAFFFLGPLFWGTRFIRVAALILLLLASFAAWQTFASERAAKNRRSHQAVPAATSL
ncbi:MAG: hypothetical protein JWO82_180 [Akkermansiaceae bacterium]|nr:hypothetical protein [Akkermansiaceae bacterium]